LVALLIYYFGTSKGSGSTFVDRLSVSLGLLPHLFVAVLLVAVPTGRPDLFGFFVGLSVIWLGGSLSLNALVGEGRIADHEHCTFLDWECWLVAKWLLFGCQSALQTDLFFLRLKLPGWLIAAHEWETSADRPTLVDLGDSVLLGIGAMGVGLLLSAIAKVLEEKTPRGTRGNGRLAVAAVHAGADPLQRACRRATQGGLNETYGAFHVGECSGRESCSQPLAHWSPERGGSYCIGCYNERLPGKPRTEIRSVARLGNIACRGPCRRSARSPQLKSFRCVRDRGPQFYLTLSRPADVLL